MTETLRPVTPLKSDGLTPSVLEGPAPELVWLALDRLVINDAYQRHISEKSVTLIRRMVERFDWGRVKALSVARLEDGRYEVIDGQHTAIAAATHGQIDALPCLVTSGKTLEARSADFVSLNRDRLSMTPMQVFYAELAAGEELAVDVARGVELAGGRVLRYPPPFARFQPGDLVCIAALKRLACRGGPAYVKRAVAICVEARCAPIKAMTLRAVEALVWGRAPVDDALIADVLRVHGQDRLVSRAIARAEASGGTQFSALTDLMRSLAEAA